MHPSDRNKQENNRWKLAVECSDDGLWDWNLSESKVFFSKGWKSMLGYEEEDIEDDLEEWSSRVHPDDLDACLKDINRHISGETERYENEHRMRCKNGAYIWIFDRGRVVEWDENGEPLRMIGLHTDVTDKKSIEAELSRMKELLEQTNSTAGVGGWEYYPDTQEVKWTSNTALLHGMHSDFQPTLKEAVEFYADEHSRNIVSLALNNLIENNVPFDEELKIRRKDGTVRFIRATGKAAFLNGHCMRAYGSFQDIHEKKVAQDRLIEQEEKFRSLFENSPVGFSRIEFPSGRFLDCNDALFGPTGYTKDEYLSLSYWDVTPPEYKDMEDAQNLKVMETGTYGPYEKEVLRKDGTRYPVLLHGFLHTDSKGRQVVWSILQDMTQIKDLENSLRQARDQAINSDKAKSAFLAAMSHEIRTPLNGIIGSVELLENTNLKQDQKGLVEMILGSCEILLSTINDVLDYSKIESDQIVLDNTIFSPLECAESVLDVIAPQARNKHLEVAILKKTRIPEFVEGDKTRIRQILTNLVSNAAKFTSQGTIAIEMAFDENQCLKFKIIDSGIGLDPEKVEQLFSPFRQADGSITRKFGGSGLGLAICRRLTDLMNGEITGENNPSSGSTFSFMVPVKESKNPHINEENSFRSILPLENKNCLIVEPSLLNQKLISQSLNSAGAEISVMDSWQDALSVIKDGNSFDIILIDRMLPDADDETIFNGLKSLHSNKAAPVVLLCSDPCERHRDLYSSILLKPLKSSTLISTCEQLLGGKGKPNNSKNQETADFSSYKVLVVEDNKINQIVVGKLLKSLKFDQIIYSENGNDAVEKFSPDLYDLILMDWQMPVMDGLEATKRIRVKESELSINKRVPIIGLSAAAFEEDIRKGLEAGMDAYLTKPLKRASLLKVMNDLAR